MEIRRKVFWVYQQKVESYIQKFGDWVRVQDDVSDEWKRGTFEYFELRDRTTTPDRFGNLGPYIVG